VTPKAQTININSVLTMAKEKDISNELIHEVIDKFTKLGYVVEDISEENPTIAHCRFYIYKEDNPNINAYAWDGKELEMTYNNLIGKLAEEEKKQEIKKERERTGLPMDKNGVILCEQLDPDCSNWVHSNTHEVELCIKAITKERIHCSHEIGDNTHRYMVFKTDKLKEMGLSVFSMNSGSHIIHVCPHSRYGDNWYSARRFRLGSVK
jgi:hypothetical protein